MEYRPWYLSDYLFDYLTLILAVTLKLKVLDKRCVHCERTNKIATPDFMHNRSSLLQCMKWHLLYSLLDYYSSMVAGVMTAISFPDHFPAINPTKSIMEALKPLVTSL